MFQEYIKTVNKDIYEYVTLLAYLMKLPFQTVVGGRREVYFPHLIPIVATNAITE